MRTHFVLTAKNLSACPNCGAQIPSHRVCPQGGFYRGKKILDVKTKDEQTDANAESAPRGAF